MEDRSFHIHNLFEKDLDCWRLQLWRNKIIDFDNPNILIGSEDVFFHPLSKYFSTVLSLDLNISKNGKIDILKINDWQDWYCFYGLSLTEYIQLIVELPELFQETSLISREASKSQIFRDLCCLCIGSAAWISHFSDISNRIPEPVGVDQYEVYGWRFKTFLYLIDDIYRCKKNKFWLFSSPAHLWFWCMVSYFLNQLKNTGLEKPLKRKELQGKVSRIKETNDLIKNLELQNSKSTKKIRNKTLADYIRNLPGVITSIAREKYITEISIENPFTSWLKAEKKLIQAVKNSRGYQVCALYCDSPNSPVKIYTSTKGIKLPERGK